MAVLQKIDNPYGMIQTVEHCESFSIYRSQDSTGDCEVTVYPVFSGIELVYYDVHMQSCDINLAKGREMLIITLRRVICRYRRIRKTSDTDIVR